MDDFLHYPRAAAAAAVTAAAADDDDDDGRRRTDGPSHTRALANPTRHRGAFSV